MRPEASWNVCCAAPVATGLTGSVHRLVHLIGPSIGRIGVIGVLLIVFSWWHKRNIFFFYFNFLISKFSFQISKMIFSIFFFISDFLDGANEIF
jgi:hypothetical protein